MIDLIKKIVAPLQRRVMNMVSRAVIKGTDDSKKMQVAKALISSDEVKDFLERFQNYGFTSNPKDGAEGIALFLGGNRDHGVLISVDDRRFRVKNLEKGEVAIYTDEGDKIHFKRDRKIEITTQELTINAQGKVIVNTNEAEVNATTKADVTTPELNVVASTSVIMTTPLLSVSGLIQCAGIGAGVAAEAGKAKVNGSLETSGAIEAGSNVKDSVGTMADMRSKYNAHHHSGNANNTPSQLM